MFKKPDLSTDLVAALASLDVDDFTHVDNLFFYTVEKLIRAEFQFDCFCRLCNCPSPCLIANIFGLLSMHVYIGVAERLLLRALVASEHCVISVFRCECIVASLPAHSCNRERVYYMNNLAYKGKGTLGPWRHKMAFYISWEFILGISLNKA